MALKAVLAFVLAVLGLHTYIIVHLSGKFGSWHLIMNIMCVSHSPGSSYSTFYKGWFRPTLPTFLCTL